MENSILDLTNDNISEMSPDEAQKHIDHFLRTSGNDQRHPYFNGHALDHKKYVERISKLYEIASPQPEVQLDKNGIEIQPFSREHLKVMEQAMQEQNTGKDIL
jgi:hypothetical protein